MKATSQRPGQHSCQPPGALPYAHSPARPQAPGPGPLPLRVAGESPLSTRHDDALAGPLSDTRAEPGPVQYMGLRRMK